MNSRDKRRKAAAARKKKTSPSAQIKKAAKVVEKWLKEKNAETSS